MNNNVYEGDFATVAVCNGKYYGRGFIMGPHARIDDGIIDVYLIKHHGRRSQKLSFLYGITQLCFGAEDSTIRDVAKKCDKKMRHQNGIMYI